jgi:hypothetical protein
MAKLRKTVFKFPIILCLQQLQIYLYYPGRRRAYYITFLENTNNQDINRSTVCFTYI